MALRRRLVVAALDACLIALAYLFALVSSYDFRLASLPEGALAAAGLTLGWIVPSALALLAWRGLYRSIWSFVSVPEFIRLTEAWAAEALVVCVGAHVSVWPLGPAYWVWGTIMAYFLTSALRFSWRISRTLGTGRATGGMRVMVVGAGEAGRMLIREMAASPSLGLVPVCAIDDNEAKHGRLIEGVPVVAGRHEIARVADDFGVEQILVALPSAPGADRREICEISQATGRQVKVVPGMYQFLCDQLSVSKLRDVDLEDLLGRDTVHVDGSGIAGLVRGRSVLVTGGGGSIGSEICRQVAKEGPRRLVVLDIYENNAYALEQELRRAYPALDLSVLIGSVRDAARVSDVFSTYAPEVVFHAAAHKHVPLMEVSPCEAIKNNVAGTECVARAAVDYGCECMVLISTDKAVNPTNVMGASKRLCELIMQREARRAQREGRPTTLSAVRFGNVLGSAGSVVPLFKRQIAEGGPVTVTDPRVIRYFMTIPEAVSLVLQAACYAKGGEIFVLDMGEPVRIDDMARNLIRLSGFEPDVDIDVVYTGLRPGEKLFEERLMSEEGLGETPNPKISVAEPCAEQDERLARSLALLYQAAARNDAEALRGALEDAVDTFHPELAGGGTPA